MKLENNSYTDCLNTQSFLFDEADDLLDARYRNFKNLAQQKHYIDESNYTYYHLDDDEKIPAFIVEEFEKTLEKQSNKHNTPTPFNSPIDTQVTIRALSHPQTVQNTSHSSNDQASTQEIYRANWEVIDIIAKIRTGSYAKLYLTHQKYNNNHYVVFTKISNKRKPRNFALPLSITGFVADCLYNALNNKEKFNDLVPTSRENWFLCNDYGTIYPHPKNHITISQQMYESQYYIVISKYDRHNKAKHFSFSVSYLQETANALKKIYTDGTQYTGEIFAIIRPDNIPPEVNKTSHYKERMLKCVCGHNPELEEIHVDFFNRPGITYYQCYCKNCKKFSRETEFDKDKAISYWNQMIRMLTRKKQTQKRFLRINSI